MRTYINNGDITTSLVKNNKHDKLNLLVINSKKAKYYMLNMQFKLIDFTKFICKKNDFFF